MKVSHSRAKLTAWLDSLSDRENWLLLIAVAASLCMFFFLVVSMLAMGRIDRQNRIIDQLDEPGMVHLPVSVTTSKVVAEPYGGCKEASAYPHTKGYRWCSRHGLL